MLIRRQRERAALWCWEGDSAADLGATRKKRCKALRPLEWAWVCQGELPNSSKEPMRRLKTPHTTQSTCDISWNLIYLVKLKSLFAFTLFQLLMKCMRRSRIRELSLLTHQLVKTRPSLRRSEDSHYRSHR